MSDGLPPVTEWPDYDDNPRGANPLTQDINAPYNKVRAVAETYPCFHDLQLSIG
jgi:hypothetical protein